MVGDEEVDAMVGIAVKLSWELGVRVLRRVCRCLGVLESS